MIKIADEKKDLVFCHCKKCGRDMGEGQFYTYKDGTKVEMCKKCLTMHIDPFDESTYVWLMEKMNVPFVPIEWNVIRDKVYAKNPLAANPTAIFGKYLSKMRLKQYKNYGYADSDEVNQLMHKLPDSDSIDPDFEAEMKAKFEAGEISEAQYKTLVSTESLYESEGLYDTENLDVLGTAEVADTAFYDEQKFMREEDLPDPAAGLTDEDKIYLATKWGRLYEPYEWVALETKYWDMMHSFDIQESDTSSTLILICKTNLKMNQAIDQGDLEGYQKLSRVYDTLRKSAKFTAAQNKDSNDNFITSIGELVDFCEKHEGEIPRYQITEPYDKIDKIIMDLKEYTKSLIYSDTALANEIEEYLQKREVLDKQKLERLMNDGKIAPVTNEDYEEYFDLINQSIEADKEVYNEQ